MVKFLSPASFWTPATLVSSAWIEHAPFAFWLIDVHRPRTLVELGTHHGYSFLAFDQAIGTLQLDTRSFAIDTWRGDEQTGFYGEEVFQRLRARHDELYSGFSQLVRSTFEEAVWQFNDGTIDLLHIDGRHRYEDVHKDFHQWKEKLSDRAVVLLHDTRVSDPGFGVAKLWQELCKEYPHFEFVHGHGLGVLGIGKNQSRELRELFAADDASAKEVRNTYQSLGAKITDLMRLRAAEDDAASLRSQITRFEADLANCRAEADEWRSQAEKAASLSAEANEWKTQAQAARRQTATVSAELDQLKSSTERLKLQLSREVAQNQALQSRLERSERDESRSSYRHNGRGRFRLSRRVINPFPLIRDMALVASSGMFQRDWYLEHNADVAKAGVHPLLHYLRHGAREGRDPGPQFNTTWYLRQNPDVEKNGINPLVHYLRRGKLEGRTALPDESAVVAQAAGCELPQPAVLAGPTLRHKQMPKVVFVSGEPGFPGHHYRVLDIAGALAPEFFATMVMSVAEASHRIEEFEDADVVWIWRAPLTADLATIMDTARRSGAKIVFDVDDLMFRPELATTNIIDGIRSQGFTESAISEYYGSIKAALELADNCTTPTSSLAREAQDLFKPTMVIPNGFDRVRLENSRAARRSRDRGDGLVRIGFAAGTATHQRDFAVIAPAVGAVLREFPNTRLVLFRNSIDVREFPVLTQFSSQIEWRNPVPLPELPFEYARFDINLAPLEVGNPFCEAKSELKFFEAALAGVPTIASPTQPFRESVRHGETGLLANNIEEWQTALRTLVLEADLRERLASQAYLEALWRYGPERRSTLVTRFINRLVSSSLVASELLRLDMLQPEPVLPPVQAAQYDLLYESSGHGTSRVTVVVPLFNYAHYVEQALDSARAQTIPDLDLVVVDDRSTDNSVAVARNWLERNAARFNRVALLQNRENSNLGRTRNAGVSFADTELFFPLDADNVLMPECIAECIARLDATGAAFVYPTLQRFGQDTEIFCCTDYDPARFACTNYIDAMALVRKACWLAVGGYTPLDPPGWEDYDLWCKFAEKGFFGSRVPRVLAKYRVHGKSMLNTVTLVNDNKSRVFRSMCDRHPWLQLCRDNQCDSPSAAKQQPTHTSRIGPDRVMRHDSRMERLLEVLRCPQSHERLRAVAGELVTESGSMRWPIIAGRPVLTPAGASVVIHPDAHLSNELPESATRIIKQTGGLVLNLSAGGTAERHENVVEMEYSIFRHTDVVGDVHALPFTDEVFEAVVCLNAFEHYREPELALAEIRRVLKPGGRLLLHTAFLQPLHEAPHHYFNCTKFGLLHWLRDFHVEAVRVSDNFNPAYSIAWIASELEDAIEKGVSASAQDELRQMRIGEFVEFWRDPSTRNAARWRKFRDIPPNGQEKLAAGWEAIVRKR